MKSFTDLVNNMTETERAAFDRIRHIVHEVAPDVEEVVTYAMPGFKYNGKYLLAIGTFKDHMSFFPGVLPESLKAKLANFKQSKGTIQFTPETPLPTHIIKEILQARIREINQTA